ncbi:MAG: hypothetical protein WDN24_03350 [Sphingomonas sp.]
MAKIARQVASERVKRDRSVRRRTIQSVLSFDLFLHQLAATRCDAAFYFTNHVASSLHRYWAATFRGDYSRIEWKDDWVARFAGEIDYAMGEADAMLFDLIAFAERDPDYVLLVCGSMGQAAVDRDVSHLLTQVLLRDANRFVAALGIAGGWRRRRTMEPVLHLPLRRRGRCRRLRRGDRAADDRRRARRRGAARRARRRILARPAQCARRRVQGAARQRRGRARRSRHRQRPHPGRGGRGGLSHPPGLPAGL